MNVYVIAPSEDGPCKIGRAQSPDRRLRELQTGNHAPLSLYHVEPIGPLAATVERAAHELLRAKQSAAGNEWYDETVSQAKIAIQTAAKNAGIWLKDRNHTFRELQLAATREWLRQKEKFEEQMEEFGVEHPDLFRLLATTYRAPLGTHSTFNDYLLSRHDGAWIRWAFEHMKKKRPSGRSQSPYFQADDFIESLDVPSDIIVAPRSVSIGQRWIEWSLGGRDLGTNEIATLLDIWNKYATAFNRVFGGPEHDIHGESDHVDDVYVYALLGDTKRDDKNKIVFRHKSFRAVLIPKRNVKLVDFRQSIFGRLAQAETDEFFGFVAPPMPDDIWENVLQEWVESARGGQEIALDTFLKNQNKRYPVIKKQTKCGPASRAWQNQLCDDDFKVFEDEYSFRTRRFPFQ